MALPACPDLRLSLRPERNKADLMMLGHNIGGLLAILALGVVFSERRRSINISTIARTLALQAAIAA